MMGVRGWCVVGRSVVKMGVWKVDYDGCSCHCVFLGKFGKDFVVFDVHALTGFV